MYTTKTKMLWGLLPGALTYDPDTGLYMMVQKWRSQAFKPRRGAQNMDYLRERARRGLSRYPGAVRRAFGNLEIDRITLLEPDTAVLTVFPRIFRCKQCSRVQSYPFSLADHDVTTAFARGWRCAVCGPTGRFEQISLVHTHQCGYVGQIRMRNCKVHGFAHLYIDKQGSNQPSRYRIRCMGPDGTIDRPACDVRDPDLLLGGAPKNHPPTNCDGMRALAEEAISDPVAKGIHKVWTGRPSHIRTCQDPATARPVGLAVLNPAYAVPLRLAEDAQKVDQLLAQFLAGGGGAPGDGGVLSLAAPTPHSRRNAIERLLKVHRENLSVFPEEMRVAHGNKLWVNQSAMWEDDLGPFPPTVDAAESEVATAMSASQHSQVGVRDDREDLVDDLIEVSHLQDIRSGFMGLGSTLDRLKDHGRASADQFARGRGLAEAMGISDIRLSSTFDIVHIQLGYVRNISDPGVAFIRPFTESGDEDALTFYARQTSTEAILVLLDPVRLVRWAARHPETPPEARIPDAAGLTEPEARKWLVTHIDHSATKAYASIAAQPTAIVYGAIHTLSHLMVQSSGQMSGVEASGLKELVYPSLPGFVLYSAQHGGFHLGGLTSLYEDHLERWLLTADAAGRDCSNDPMCRSGRMKSHEASASCYACLEGSELACQRFNRDLDRAYLVGTVPQRRGTQFEGLWKTPAPS